MPTEVDEARKVFISYSWTSLEHETRVLDLATSLVEAGVDVLLDKWDLREGADINCYMEKMVSDKTIDKVIIICDKGYTDKANGRIGGVGTETLIVTPELYNQSDPASSQQRYIPIVMGKDDKGKAFLPVYLSGRFYIDMSSPDRWATAFEQLIRAIYDKPVHVKPQLGIPPAYVHSETAISLGTTTQQRMLLSAIKENKPTTIGLCQDYLEAIVTNFERFRIVPVKGIELDDQVLTSIGEFEAPRNEIVDVLITMIRFLEPLACGKLIHSFFEKLFKYTQWPEGQQSWNEATADNYRFIINELFLYSIAITLKNERFDLIPILLNDFYYYNHIRSSQANPMLSYVEFRFHLKSLAYRKERLSLRRISLQADILRERALRRQDITFTHIQQADFFLFIHSHLHKDGTSYFPYWWPTTLVFIEYAPRFEIFARAQSINRFNALKIALGIDDAKQLRVLAEEFRSGVREPPNFNHFETINPGHLMGIEDIATKP